MLLPWSKQSTLAISTQGIAIKQIDGKPHLLTDSNFQWTSASQLLEILGNDQSSFDRQQVSVLLSNTLVRYLVLPWQNEVFSRKDWQSIAQHEFRKQYGVIADSWKVSVSLGSYGQAVIAAAIDANIFEQIETSAKALNFTVISVQPLLMALLNTAAQSQNDWTLIAEPERILLCRIHEKQWQQIVIDSPPTGFEYQHAEQIINRNLLQVATSDQPSKVSSYVSGALNKTWEQTGSKLQKMMMKSTYTQSHALWMSELPINYNSQNLNLDFAEKNNLNPSTKSWGFLTIALLAMSFLYTQYQHTTEQIRLEVNQAQTKFAARPYVNAAPDIQDKLKLAQQTQQQLDLPWMQMLKALETVKVANPNIDILSISPNKNRAEIKLTGQTAEFSDLTAFLDALRTNSNFSDAVLVSQHLADEQAKLLYVFEINLAWRI